MRIVYGLALAALVASSGLPAAAGLEEAPAGCRELADKIAADCTVKGFDKFHGFDRIKFDFRGYSAWLVVPPCQPAPGKPWTWCMQWAEAFVPRTNVPELLRRGCHHATIDTFRHHMDAEGIRVSAEFQRYLVDRLGLAPKANLIGMSWGGFFSVRYTVAHPENVRKIYLDAPLLTFTPGKVDGVGSWRGKMPEGGWLQHPEMPVNLSEKLAATGVPVLLLYGGQDQTVPPETSAELFARRFAAAGGKLQTVKRGGFGHHPHGIEESDTLIADFFGAAERKPVADFPGEISGKSGWKLVGSEKGKIVYIPFEGYYESKGGRIESPRFGLDKDVGENAYYKLSFTSMSADDGYWWIDFYGSDGKLLPDVNSRLYASADWKQSEVMVPANPLAASAVIAFISGKGVRVKDVSFARATLDEAVEWCARQYAELPRLDFKAPADCWAKAPNAKTALKVGKKFNVVLLGDSIMNDSYCGLMTALAQKEFPDTKIRFDISVRGSTGCWFYRDPQNFRDYVAKYQPQLVLIGGISNYLGGKHHSLREAEDAMVETIERCKALGAEVIVCTPPPSYEFRTDAAAKPFDRKLSEPESGDRYRYLYSDYERRAAERTGVQVWDLTTAPCEAISRSGRPLDWFKRDAAHNDDRGKQLIAQTFAEYFRAAWR